MSRGSACDFDLATVPLTLRSYQERIASTAVAANTLVVLPTGAGKTLIAATAIHRICGPFDSVKKRNNPCALFLVPTRLLVKQQASALRQALPGAHVAEFAGGLNLPRHLDVLVTTPKAFQMRQNRSNGNDDALRLDWAIWKVLVFDEVHHVLKDHPYRRIALSLRNGTVKPADAPRIVGLTASYTYAVGEDAVRKSLRRMCDELRIQTLETANRQELERSGYHAKAAAPEVDAGPTHAGETIVPVGVHPVEERKPHLMIGTFFRRVELGQTTPFSKRLMNVIAAMESDIRAKYPNYQSPIGKNRAMKSWGAHAYAMRKRDGRFEELSMWYEAMRLLIVSWEESEDATAMFLRMSGCEISDDDLVHGSSRRDTRIWSSHVIREKQTFWIEVPMTFPRFERLKRQLLFKYTSSDMFRGILFVQQRVMTHIVEYVVQSDPELSCRFSPTCIYAASTPATVTLSVSKSESARRLAQFKNGAVNLLIATAVAEEGMDIPAANCVIRFDAILHAVSLVQGRGRARQKDSSLVVLSERTDRPISKLEEVEKQQLHLMQTFDPALNPEEMEQENEKRRKEQHSREISAWPYLIKCDQNASAIVQLFSKKTKVDIEMDMRKDGDSWCCSLSYSSVLRSVYAKGSAIGKKKAKQAAMEKMLVLLKSEFQEC